MFFFYVIFFLKENEHKIIGLQKIENVHIRMYKLKSDISKTHPVYNN